MADDGVQKDGEAGAGTASRRGGMGVILGVTAASLVGAAGGVALVGPMAADRLSAAPAEAEEEAPKNTVVEQYTVESLVLNPAETKGTRFLMASIVATVAGHGGREAMEERDPEVRDRLMSLLGSKTVDELTDVAHREELKEEIRGALEKLVEPHEVRAVFLPTFVIQ